MLARLLQLVARPVGGGRRSVANVVGGGAAARQQKWHASDGACNDATSCADLKQCAAVESVNHDVYPSLLVNGNVMRT
jgi:hypothetical protein